MRKQKAASLITILGLAMGLTCFLLIALYVFHETSYDRFHAKAARIVRVNMEFSFDGVVNKVAVTGNKVFPAFKQNFPQVEDGVRMLSGSAVVKYNDRSFNEDDFAYADSTFFNIFSFYLLKGLPGQVLQAPNTIVVTSSTARKYFGNADDAIGKVLRVNGEKNYMVTGVMQDCPDNSQIKFDFIASFSSLDDRMYKELTWWNANYITYLLLKDARDISALEARIPAYMHTQRKEAGIEEGSSSYITFHLEPLTKVHLYAAVDGGFEPSGDYRYIYIFSAIALLILGIASANYMNMATARASERAREVGVRKVMGALRRQLFGQFMGESVASVVIALLISLLATYFLLPFFNDLSGKHLSLAELQSPVNLGILLLILSITALLGGGYPALVLSGFQPIKVLKGDFKTGFSGIWLRKTLIVTQFIISVGLIICTFIIHGQLGYIHQRKLGYDREHIVMLPIDKIIRAKLNTFKAEFKTDPHVVSITSCTQSPVFIPGKYGLNAEGRSMILTAEGVDRNYVKTMGLQLRAGTDFTEADEQNADSDSLTHAVMINESAASSLGLDPQAAIGKAVRFQNQNSIVKAVIKDFHFASLHQPIGPIVIFLNGYQRYLLVKVTGGELDKTIQFMKAKWDMLAPHRPFEYTFMDDEFNKLYIAEARTGKLFYVFALLAIGLACLGLFGLATFTAQQRTKEIGIRKILGASIAGIVMLLSKEFIQLIIIAALIASPLAWWTMHQWLGNFAYRIHISAWIFILAAGAALTIALATVSWQAIRAALSNPVKSLRTE